MKKRLVNPSSPPKANEELRIHHADDEYILVIEHRRVGYCSHYAVIEDRRFFIDLALPKGVGLMAHTFWIYRFEFGGRNVYPLAIGRDGW